jgi:hypothetical protein
MYKLTQAIKGSVWIGLLFLNLCETAYANKLAFMYYYKLFKVVYDKTTYKNTIFVSKTYEST